MSGRSYREAGVDIDAGAALVEAIKPLARATARPGAAAGLGGFGAAFDLAAAGYRDPLLIATTDGVGTKVKVAIAAGRHGTIGIDLVAMCVNDLLVEGAEPLFFLDYFACGRLEVATAAAVIAGVADGCRLAGCALIGGETAEMPGMYADGDYDLAGFAVGAVERNRHLTGASVRPGDMVLGLASSGCHSNGFSLVRRLLADAGLEIHDPAPFSLGKTCAEALLEPTRIYVASVRPALAGGHVKALAHITGGGLLDNLPRVLPAGVVAEIDGAAWDLPAVFRWLKAVGRLSDEELARTFNCGIGLMAVVAAEDVEAVQRTLTDAGETVFPIGAIRAAAGEAPAVVMKGTDRAWRS